MCFLAYLEDDILVWGKGKKTSVFFFLCEYHQKLYKNYKRCEKMFRIKIAWPFMYFITVRDFFLMSYFFNLPSILVMIFEFQKSTITQRQVTKCLNVHRK